MNMPSTDRISNVIVWSTRNDLLVEACTSLLNEKDRMWMMPSNEIVYSMQGQILAVPIARKAAHYQTTHWYPTVLVYGDKKSAAEKYERLKKEMRMQGTNKK
jgi:hypothetical protein